ncbi:wax ester/triacylglycerol synthase domain-containing protein [Nocardia sp. NPDC059177]|uniref:wax ester/triacylglycerol synthase domain-containing protein n=1 Tax=Nocardia sp. NPDC059177 TaxID=3346759 RepID=UPI0036CD58BA
MIRMAPRDATMFWLSRRSVNDVFLLYAFAETEAATEELRDFVAARSARIPDLRIRLQEIPGNLDYPFWISSEFASQQFVAQRPDGSDWRGVLARIGELLGTGVVATEHPWRVHVFRGVRAVPGTAGPVLVVVLQLSHALADGTRAAGIARALFGPAEVVHSHSGESVDNLRNTRVRPAKTLAQAVDSCGQIWGWSTGTLPARVRGALRFPQQLVTTAWRGRAAHLAQRELADRTAAGEVPAAATGFAPALINPSTPIDRAAHRVHLHVVDAGSLRIPGHTVTVVALTVISSALSDYLAERGEHRARLGTALPMAIPADGSARNNYRGLSIDLHIDEPDLSTRATLIAAELAVRRERAMNPLLAVQDRVGETVPAMFAAQDVARADLDNVPPALDGNTVVSSVNRGAADLAFAGAPVLFTGGFPALGTVMHLTHGVHGIGETITLSVHSDANAVPDPDRYLDLLTASLTTVVAALR